MSFIQCILGKAEAGLITREQAERVVELYDQLKAADETVFGTARNDRAIVDRVANVIKQDTAIKQKQAALQIVRTYEAHEIAKSHSKGLHQGYYGLLSRDIYDEVSGHANVESLQRGIEGDAHGILNEAIETHRTRAFRFADKEGLNNWVRAIFGEGNDAEARAYAKAWAETNQMLVERFQKAGGDLRQRSDWNLPNPMHDSIALTRATVGKWIEDILPLLDRSKMLDLDTGLPLSDERLIEVLSEVFETLRTEGLNKQVPGSGAGVKKVANRHQAPRVLHFKDAESWLAYNEQYGGADVFTTLMSHVNNMSREIALMEVLGPNADTAARQIKQLIDQDRVKAGKERGTKGDHFMNIYRAVAGADEVGSQFGANLGQSIRNWLAGQQLGGAVLSAVTDFAFMKKTTDFNGLSATKAMKHYTALLNPGNAQGRKAASQMAIMVEDMLGASLAGARYADVATANTLTSKYADFIMRASGLSPHTAAARRGFGMMMYSELAESSGKAFGDLQKDMRQMLDRYGIDADEWEIVRKSSKMEYQGDHFVQVSNIAAEGHADLATKLKQMVNQEMDFAIPTSNARVQALIAGDSKKGTWSGEARRFLTMYKRFPVLIIHSHLARGLFSPQMGKMDKGKYLASLMLYTTVMGAFAVQLKQIAAGRDPLDMKTTEFWAGAAMQGGGLGIFGDYLYSGFVDPNRSGHRFGTTLLGPAFGPFNSALNIAGGSSTPQREAVKAFKRYLVPGSSLWYAKVGMNRLVEDQLLKAVDPKASQYFNRLERRSRREQGQEFWWGMGDIAPSRAPDLGEIGG